MNQKLLSEKIKEKAKDLGFMLVGITSPEPPPNRQIYLDWLAAGHHGQMKYMESEHAIQGRNDPRSLLPGCKSILVLGMPYFNPANAPPPSVDQQKVGRIAAYAWGDDYHESMKHHLQALVVAIEELCGEPVENRCYIDSGPILESDLAQRAGLGWTGKNSLLINPKRGSYFLLAEILLGIELEFDQPIENDYCGSCTRCINACPTRCILPNRTLDANRCISYLSIEVKDAIPANLRPVMDNWVFGCDICQQVCPWNIRFAPVAGHRDFSPRNGLQNPSLETELEMDSVAFNARFQRNPVKRPKRRGYLRNVAIALGNSGHLSHVPALSAALFDKEELIRGHAAWALGVIGGKQANDALANALKPEENDWVKEEIKSALKKMG